jgi:hypothetical protein
MLNDTEKKFLETAKYLEQLSEKKEEVRAELEGLMKTMGEGAYVQDPETLVVYKVIKPNGTFIYFRDLDYKRTALEGERGGTVLSKKEAEEAGFVLKK